MISYIKTLIISHINMCMHIHSVMSDSLWPYGLVAHQAPLCMELSRQVYWSGLLFPTPGALPDLGIKTTPELAGRFFTTVSPGKPHTHTHTHTWQTCLVAMKTKKPHNLPSASWRIRKYWYNQVQALKPENQEHRYPRVEKNWWLSSERQCALLPPFCSINLFY